VITTIYATAAVIAAVVAIGCCVELWCVLRERRAHLRYLRRMGVRAYCCPDCGARWRHAGRCIQHVPGALVWPVDVPHDRRTDTHRR
jgi:hypothetical protein